MFKIIIVALALVACVVAKPGLLAPAPLAYANAPLYAAGGSQQVDVRNNYDGTLSSYATAPFGYAGPVSSRYIAGVPAAHFATPLAAGPLAAAPLTATALATVPVPAAYAASFAHPFAGPFAAHFGGAPLRAPVAAALRIAAPAPVLV